MSISPFDTEAVKKQKLQELNDKIKMVSGKLTAEQAKLIVSKLAAGQPSSPPGILRVPTATTPDVTDPASGGVNMSEAHRQNLEHQLLAINKRIENAQQVLQTKEQVLREAEYRAKGNLVTNDNARGLELNMNRSLSAQLAPGNVGEINRVLWPFWFSSSKAIIQPERNVQGFINVTQEAAFVLTSFTKAVYEEQGEAGSGEFLFIDPAQPGAAGKSNGLSVVFRDASSSREFMGSPIDVNQVGTWEDPTVLNTPQMFLPNANIEVNWFNADTEATYMAVLTFFGYRVRIEDAQNILSLLTGR